jgi:hypothetical protein
MNSNESIKLFNNGNLVINSSTDAGYRLDVSGSTRLNGNTQITGSLNVSGSITTTGTITAQTLVVQTVSSSVIYSSGSNIFGNNLANNQVFTGSVLVTGSITVATPSVPARITAFAVLIPTTAPAPITDKPDAANTATMRMMMFPIAVTGPAFVTSRSMTSFFFAIVLSRE